ncbi:MAG: carbohydrate ABC transporter permease [Firmicutes bacterium]|nr:carbohydrate ABC transporter permease [Bacillota bacterium]
MVLEERIAGQVRYRRRVRKFTGMTVLNHTRWGLLYLALIVGGFINIYPFLWMVSVSFKDLPEFARGGLNLIPSVVHWDNYTTAWTEAEFGRYFFNTSFIAIVPTVTSLLTAAMAGYALARRNFPGKTIFIVGAVVMMFIPHGFTVIPVFTIIWKLGLLHTLLGVILPGLSGGLLTALIFMAYYTSVSTGASELEDAAKIDGATFFQTFWYVMLPLGRPMMATWGVLGFIGGWNSFIWPLIVSLGNEELRTLTVGLYAFREEHMTEWTLLMAGTTIGLVPIIVLFFIAQRWIIEGLAGAIKA